MAQALGRRKLRPGLKRPDQLLTDRKLRQPLGRLHHLFPNRRAHLFPNRRDHLFPNRPDHLLLNHSGQPKLAAPHRPGRLHSQRRLDALHCQARLRNRPR